MIEVVVGPMWSEKTTYLIQLAKGSAAEYEQILALKPERDIRHPDDHPGGSPHFRTATGLTYPCTLVPGAELRTYAYLAYGKNLVLVDEGQFVPGGLMELAHAFLGEVPGKLVIAGLDVTSEGYPFGLMPQVMPLATKLTFLRSRCSTVGCLMPGTRTIHTGKKDGDVKVGYDGYSVGCDRCWKRAQE